MKSVELSQQEIQYILAAINIAFKEGALSSLDAIVFVPIVLKLTQLVDKPKVEEKPEEKPKN